MHDCIADSVFGLVLAAGKSSRMGQPKMDLPWGNTSILGAVINQLHGGGIETIHIVVNPWRKPVPSLRFSDLDIHWIENPDAEVEDMLVSIQTGLRSLPAQCQYAMICPGDQPMIAETTVKAILAAAANGNEKLVFPSYHMHRGHPWMVHRDLWKDILSLENKDSVRTFITQYQNEIFYVNIDADPPVDIDTPEDYQRLIQSIGK
jgi:molybdenum cofactor cytidylyltransferase